MDKSLLIKRLVERADANKKLTEADNLSISNADVEPSDLFNKCTRFIKEISDLSYDFEYLKAEAPKLELTRKDFRCLCDTICEYLGDTVEALCIKPVFTTPSRLEGCPISTDEIVMYTKKPFDVNLHTTVTYDGDNYKTVKCYLEKTPYYEIYLTIVELI